MSDAIVHGLTACTAFILQIVIFKLTTHRPVRYWVLLLAGVAIMTLSFLGILFPKSGFIALVFLHSVKSFKNLRHTILESFFIPFTFALMVRLVISLIIPIFFSFCLRLQFRWLLNPFLSLLTLVCSECSSTSRL